MTCELCSEPEPHQHEVSCELCGAKVVVTSDSINSTVLPNGWYIAKSMDTKNWWTICSTKCALTWVVDKHRIRFDRKINHVPSRR